MKWISHQICALGLAAGAGASLPLLAGVGLGAVLPDRLDRLLASFYRNKQRGWGKVHRGPTHWFGWWLALAWAGWRLDLLLAPLPARPLAVQSLILGLGLGGLSHILLDMLTPKGVPLLLFNRKSRLSLNLVTTGALSEKIFLLLFCLALAAWKYPAAQIWLSSGRV